MNWGFNPRTYIRYDALSPSLVFGLWFQSTYLYKVRPNDRENQAKEQGFNPRTYIRYDSLRNFIMFRSFVSIHVPI